MRVAVGIPEEEEIKRARGPVESLDPGSLGDRGHWDDELTVSALIGRAHLDGRPGRHSLRIEPTRRRVPRSTLSEVEGLRGGFVYYRQPDSLKQETLAGWVFSSHRTKAAR